MACLPLDGLVMFATHDLSCSWQVEQRRATQYLLHHLLPMWPLLQCVRLVPAVAHGFIAMLLEDNGGCEKPLLPSLTQFVMVDFPIDEPKLSDALRKRVKQRVPVKVLDMRMCGPLHPADDRTNDRLQSLSKIVGNILPPEQTYKARQEIEYMWDAVARGHFVDSHDREAFRYEVLLNIFRYYLDSSPRFWPRLVHICRKWRRIVFASQRALRLRLFCTHGTPVRKTLDWWPTLPIVVQYGGSPALDPPAPEDEDDIVAALEQSDRVTSIGLTVTSSLLEKLSAIEGPFSELEDLVLLSRDSVRLTLAQRFSVGLHAFVVST
jgi:hypothetical protein